MDFHPYRIITRFLARHKKMSLFLSHGGLHILVLIMIIIATAISISKVSETMTKNYLIFDFECLPKEGNIPVEYFCFKINPNAKGQKYEYRLHANIDSLFKYNPKYRCSWDIYSPLREQRISHKVKIDKGDNDLVTYETDRSRLTIDFKSFFVMASSTMPIVNDCLERQKDNPYKIFQLKVNVGMYNLNDSSEVVIDLSPYKNDDHTVITFEKVFPQPTEYGLNKVVFRGKTDVERILRDGGLYIEAQDSVKAFKADRYALVFSVMAGTLIAFALDIIINLIYKWRRLER